MLCRSFSTCCTKSGCTQRQPRSNNLIVIYYSTEVCNQGWKGLLSKYTFQRYKLVCTQFLCASVLLFDELPPSFSSIAKGPSQASLWADLSCNHVRACATSEGDGLPVGTTTCVLTRTSKEDRSISYSFLATSKRKSKEDSVQKKIGKLT